MYALVDCNNFYASCERQFNPRLIGQPIVVLSNNDGCVIARSDEAKDLGVSMGSPAYMFEDFFRQHRVKVFSSNYTLYGDMSARVMNILASFVPQLELYSIDEAFLDMSEMAYTDLLKLGHDIRNTVIQHTGIPVSVGIAPTRALAKMANRYAKKKFKAQGVFYAANEKLVSDMLEFTEVDGIWGIGRQHALLLRNNKITTAKEFAALPAQWVREQMSVVGLRLWNELRGTPSFEWEFTAKEKKNICTSRSLGKLTSDLDILKEAISNHAAVCAAKLRAQQSVCKKVQVFIATNPHKTQHKQYSHSIILECQTATNLTGEIIGYALKGLAMIFQPEDYLYMKCGVIVLDVIPSGSIQAQKALPGDPELCPE
ncbi:MAG: Y-family DNA polymerase [Chitinophagaceae bacterium]|nr:MAG: Y-family DNA polymerase [Chitinophagaceae bacterium]